VLWQLPERMKRDVPRLSGALDALPPGKHCFEFRHESWFADEVLDYAERLTRAEIASIPDGAYAFEDCLDDDGIGGDSQQNILDSTGPGLVHVLSGGTSVGIGLVLTESGKVLTTYRPAAGAPNLTAEYVLSRQIFKATVIGTDPADGLAAVVQEAYSAFESAMKAPPSRWEDAGREPDDRR